MPRSRAPRARSSRRPVVALTALALGLTNLTVLVGAPAQAATPQFQSDLVSADPVGATASYVQPHWAPQMSADGRFVAFTADVATDTAKHLQAVVTDRANGRTAVVSHLAGDSTVWGDADSRVTGISADGRYVGFCSAASNLGAVVPPGWDCTPYVADTLTGELHHPDMRASSSPVSQVDVSNLSDDGSTFAVAVEVGRPTTGAPTLDVYNWRTGTRQSVPSIGVDEYFFHPSLSGDGTTLAYGDLNWQNYVHSLQVRDLTRGVTTYSATGFDVSTTPSLSADGSRVAFETTDVKAHVARIGGDEVTVTQYGIADSASISRDGSTLAFTSKVHNWEDWTAYRLDLAGLTGSVVDQATLVSVDAGGQSLSSYASRPMALSPHGDGIAFLSAGHYSGYEVRVAHTVDIAAPTWGAGSSVATSNLTGSSVTLTWPAATDDSAVAGYSVSEGGTLLADTLEARTLEVTGRTPGTTHTFTVEARDMAGNTVQLPPTEVAFPVSSQTGDAPLAVTAAAGGTATLRWDPSPSARSYRIRRAVGDAGPFATVAEGLTTTTWTDSNLLAETHYRYVVDEVGDTGAAPYTVEAATDTPPITINRAQVTPVLVDGSAIDAQSSVTMRVDGEANRTASMTLHWAGAPDSALTLPERAAGTYVGSVPVPAGASALTSATATLSDGEPSHSATSDVPDLPRAVSGVLHVVVNAPDAGDLAGSVLKATSTSLATTKSLTIGGPGTFDVSVPAAADYQLQLTIPAGEVVARTDPVAVAAGAVTDVALDPVWPFATLTVHVEPPPGQPQGGVTVTISDGGSLSRTVVVPDGSSDAVFADLLTGSTLTITTTVNDRSRLVQLVQTTTTTLAQGQNTVTVTQKPLGTAAVEGTVSAAGRPYAGELVRLTESVDGRSWSYTATSGPDGRYRATVLAGHVAVSTVVPPLGYHAANVAVDVGADATATADLDMGAALESHLVHLRLTTQDLGAAPSPQTLDWTTNIHFHTTLTDADGQSWGIQGNDFVVPSTAAQLTFCADGREAGFDRACTTVPMDTYEVSLSLALSQVAGVTGTILAPSGTPSTGRWSVSATPVDATGKTTGAATTTSGDGSALRIGVPAAGRYRLQVNASGGSFFITVDLAAGQQLELGTLQIVTGSPFSGDTTVIATPASVLPGQLVELRVQYTAATAMSAAVLRLAVPASTTLEPEGVTLDGTPVAGTLADGFYEVPLGDLSSGVSGVVRYSLSVDAGAPAGPLSAVVRVRYAGSTERPVGAATVDVVGVTLDAPTHVVTPGLAVTGRGAAGAQVTVRESGEALAIATAGTGGLWSASVTLPTPLDGATYVLQATVDEQGRRLTSQGRSVTYDTSWLSPTSMTVSQPSGRAHTFDPAQGTASFTLVYVPSEPVTVSATFADTSRLKDPVAIVGGARAPMKCTTTTCTADVAVNSTTIGDVWLDYDVAPDKYATPDDVVRPTAEQAAALSHTVYGDLTDLQVYGDTATGRLDGRPFTVQATSSEGALPEGMTPMAGRVPGYYSLDVDTATGTSTMTVALPKSWTSLASTTPGWALTSQATTSMMALAPAVSGGEVYELATWVFKGLYPTMPDLVSNTAMDQLLKLDEEIAASKCLPETKDQLRGIVQDSAAYSAYVDAAGSATNVLLGTFTEGLNIIGNLLFGTAVSGSFTLAAAPDLSATIAEIHHDIAACGTTSYPPGYGPPKAHLTVIFDPSGYVYEALPSQRLEGVTATIETAPSAAGPWTQWDASAFGQDNPQVTDAHGHYGWDVPVAWYRVRFERPGYRTDYSRVVHVLPEWSDLNVGLVSLTPPTMTSAELSGDTITYAFSTWMDVPSVVAATAVHGPGRAPWPGTVEAVDPQTAPDGTVLATSFVFHAQRSFRGPSAGITVGVSAQHYGGVALTAPEERTFSLR